MDITIAKNGTLLNGVTLARGAQATVSDVQGAAMIAAGVAVMASQPLPPALTLNTPLLIAQANVPSILPSSGTINTGTSGQLALTTALDATYSDGAWVYLPAIATTPAITAGLYWVVFSSTTVGTIYSGGPSGFPLNITAGLAYTQTTGSAITLTPSPIAIAGGAMGANGMLDIVVDWTRPNTANSITTSFVNGTGTDNASTGNATPPSGFAGRSVYRLRNRNRPDRNMRFHPAGANPGYAGAAVFLSFDTSNLMNVNMQGTLSTATDYLVMQGFTATVFYGA